MILAGNCRRKQRPQDWMLPGTGDAPCCCTEGLGGHLLDDEPLCRSMKSEGEVYRFFWDSSFDGHAVVHIGCRGDTVTLRWRYRRFILYPDDAPTDAVLPLDAWARLQAQLVGARFWTLEPRDQRLGLDGATWLVEGRRSNAYHRVERWSPEGELHTLGQLFFELAGPPLSKLRL